MNKWIFLIVFILFLLFLPKIASFSFLKPLVVKELRKKTGVPMDVSSFSFSWTGPQSFHHLSWNQEGIQGSIETLTILAPFWSFVGPFELKNGRVLYPGGSVEKIEGTIHGNDFSLRGMNPEGQLLVKGKIFSKKEFDLEVDIQKFPLQAIDATLASLLGSTINLIGTISFHEKEGSMHLDVASPYLKTRIDAFLTPEKITLQKPMEAFFDLTPEMSSFLLKDINPLFLTGISSKKPAFLKIDSEGFLFPLPYSLSSLKVGKALLDLGETRCRNGKSLAAIIAFLKQKSILETKTMNAWFTPVLFQISNGILTADRMDALLADSIHICTWGSIDLLRDRLNLFLGIPAKTLHHAFGIKHLPPHYVLKVPIKGKTQDPQIEKAEALAKIGAWLAVSKISKKGLFKEFANLISSPKEDRDVPPAKHPFPWES